METGRHYASLEDELSALSSELEALDLDSGVPAMWGLGSRKERLARSIQSYLIPRLKGDAGPLLVVFAGPTGSGKSTLINSIAGLDLSVTGPLRPTTTGPVVLAANEMVSSFRRISGVECEVVGGGAPILSKVALVDTPDLDSTSTENRAMAEILIDNADVVVFVTSALRYADLVPWEVLRRASSRGAPIVNVINRLGAGSSGAVTDFRARLEREGLDSNVVRVPEHHISAGGHRLPGLAVRELQKRVLTETSEIEADRREVVDRVTRSTATQILQLADDLDSIIDLEEREMAEASAALEEATRALDLTPLCEGPVPPAPSSGAVAGLWWRWRNSIREDRWVVIKTTLCQRLAAIVEAEIRQSAVGQPRLRELPQEGIEEARIGAWDAARAWLGQLESMSPSGLRSGGRLGALVLADAAVRGRRTPAFDALFEDGSLVARAHRGLLSRLETVYGRLLARSERLEEDFGPSREDADRLRELAATVAARSHFADA